jgi:hypothetical protein
VVVRVEGALDQRRAMFALQIGALGDTVAFQSSLKAKPGQIELFALQGALMKDLDSWSRFNKEKRKAFLEHARTEPPPQFAELDLKLDALPKE